MLVRKRSATSRANASSALTVSSPVVISPSLVRAESPVVPPLGSIRPA
jgi:hypothetical protein